MHGQSQGAALSALLRPRVVLVAALVIFALGAVAVFAGAGRVGPMGLLLGELLAIYGLILWATPAIPPFSSSPPESAAPVALAKRSRARVYDAPDR